MTIERIGTSFGTTNPRFAIKPANTAAGATPEVSLSGLVDAIIEVGRQRKSVLDQMRSALMSANDAEALRFARQYCGLVSDREQ